MAQPALAPRTGIVDRLHGKVVLPMLRKIHIKGFRSIRDSGELTLGNLTCSSGRTGRARATSSRSFGVLDIGLPTLCARCPHFARWIDELEAVAAGVVPARARGGERAL